MDPCAIPLIPHQCENKYAPVRKVVIALKFVDYQLCAETSLVFLGQISKFTSYFVLLSKVVSAHAHKQCIFYR